LEQNEAAIGCSDGTISIIDLETFEEKQRLTGHQDKFAVNTVKYHPNKKMLMSGSRDAHLNLWDAGNNYVLIKQIPAHNYAIYSIVFSPDSSHFATASRDKTVKIWNAEQQEVILRISSGEQDGHIRSVNKLLWSNYENYLLSTGDDHTIKVWELS